MIQRPKNLNNFVTHYLIQTYIVGIIFQSQKFLFCADESRPRKRPRPSSPPSDSEPPDDADDDSSWNLMGAALERELEAQD